MTERAPVPAPLGPDPVQTSAGPTHRLVHTIPKAWSAQEAAVNEPCGVTSPLCPNQARQAGDAFPKRGRQQGRAPDAAREASRAVQSKTRSGRKRDGSSIKGKGVAGPSNMEEDDTDWDPEVASEEEGCRGQTSGRAKRPRKTMSRSPRASCGTGRATPTRGRLQGQRPSLPRSRASRTRSRETRPSEGHLSDADLRDGIARAVTEPTQEGGNKATTTLFEDAARHYFREILEDDTPSKSPRIPPARPSCSAPSTCSAPPTCSAPLSCSGHF
eukprot:jgi/Botrbrau1/11719/Bobra.0195s0047.1